MLKHVLVNALESIQSFGESHDPYAGSNALRQHEARRLAVNLIEKACQFQRRGELQSLYARELVRFALRPAFSPPPFAARG